LDKRRSALTFDEILKCLDGPAFRQSPMSGIEVVLAIAEPIFQHGFRLTLVIKVTRAETSIPAFARLYKASDRAVEKRTKCRTVSGADPNFAESLTGKGRKFVL
jgi:hypothetical protein